MYAWDLGVYDQSMYSTVHYGRLFFSTVEWPYTMSVVPAGTQLAVHFSPVLFLLLPIYAVFPSPVTLLVLKTIAVALGAFPVYLMGRRRFSNPWTSPWDGREHFTCLRSIASPPRKGLRS